MFIASHSTNAYAPIVSDSLAEVAIEVRKHMVANNDRMARIDEHKYAPEGDNKRVARFAPINYCPSENCPDPAHCPEMDIDWDNVWVIWMV